MTIQPAHYSQCGCHTAQGDRQVLSSLVCGEGVALDQGGGLQVLPTTPAAMAVNVFSGNAFIQGDNVDWQGMYHVSNDGTARLPVVAADPAQDRIDLVIAEVRDSQYTGTACDWQLRVVVGTPASPPTIPSTPANAVALASFTVVANSSTVPAVNDLRFAYSLCQSALPQVTRPIKLTFSGTTGTIDFVNTYPWCKRAIALMQGAGGAGGDAEPTLTTGVVSFGNGGGGGGYARVEIIPSLVSGGILTVTGGAHVTGGDGNDSVLTDGTTTVKALGGVAGLSIPGASTATYVASDLNAGTSSGSGSSGFVGEFEVSPGDDGGQGWNNGSGKGAGGNGGRAFRGGGGAGRRPDTISGNGFAGDNPGGGGGGAYNGPSVNVTHTGGAGGDGVVVVYLYDH